MASHDPSPPRWSRTLADAVTCALLLVFSEAVTTAIVRRVELTGGWEVQQGLRHLVLIAWESALPIALLSAVGLRVLRTHPKSARVGLTLVVTIAATAVSVGVTGGRHFENGAVRAVFCLLIAASAAAIAWLALPFVRRAIVLRTTASGLVALAAIVLIAAVNVLVLPGLYPAFHLALAVAAVVLSPLVALLWADSSSEGRMVPALEWSALVIPALLIPVVPHAAKKLAAADNVRFVFGSHALVLAPAIEIAAKISPPVPLDVEGPTTVTSTPRALSWQGRDIVLISIDALRADHVSSYGYTRKTTPNIDQLATSGVRFEQAFCATPHTSYSVTSMLTGKYMRPLLLQGVAEDSDTLAGLLRTYGYRTSAFYPPAVFFIDGPRFKSFEQRYLDFEYRRIEFGSSALRAEQAERYLNKASPDRRLLMWFHLFEPHESYERHPEFPFGDRDVDLYDGEVATADAGVGAIVKTVRRLRPNAIVIVTADHGEEFGEHGGRYHGTSVFDEQVRVPLIINAPELIEPRVVKEAVQTIDILPTILSALDIPRPARVRGNDLGTLIAGKEDPAVRDAFSETDDATLLARKNFRLVCLRKVSACQLFDIEKDPSERRDISAQAPDVLVSMKKSLQALASSHGRFESSGRRSEGKDLPEALRRGLAGDGDATLDVAALLDDADVVFRRKAAQVLFELARPESAAALRLAMTRDEDDLVKRWSALALTRMGQGAMRVVEMIDDPDLEWKRLAALALAEAGDRRGEDVLIAWWSSKSAPFERARDIATALGKIKSKNAVVPLIRGLEDLRLRPFIARALAQIGESAARPPLLDALSKERYLPTRAVLARALIDLGAQAEMAPTLTRFLGTPDPLDGGLGLALKGKFLASIGGPDIKDLPTLTAPRSRTIGLDIIIPRAYSEGHEGRTRLLLRGRSRTGAERIVRVGKVALAPMSKDGKRDTSITELDRTAMVEVKLPASEHDEEVFVDLPASIGAAPARGLRIAVERTDDVDISALAVVPLVDDIPPPAPEPWTPPPGSTDGDDGP
ncbi:MAG: sulfatase-like hydrolase/transferase [Polyangiaceae bacterium]